MSILREIQDAAVDGKCDLGALLRKCKILAARLGSEPLANWLLWESNGYPAEAGVPEYRIWELTLKGHFAGPFGSGLQFAPIPLVCIPEQYRHYYQAYNCRQSAPSLEATIKSGKKGYLRINTSDLSVALGASVYRGQHCVEAWGEVGEGHILELLNSVRNGILDFSLEVEKLDPRAGEDGNSDISASLQPASVSHIFQTTVLGGNATFVGSAWNSTLTLNISHSDFKSLAATLGKQGVTPEDIGELELALSSEPKPAVEQKVGPKVGAWIGKMVQKAAEGTWEIGVAVAGELLSQSISKYYGWK